MSSDEARFQMTPGWWDARMSLAMRREVNATRRGARMGEGGSGGMFGLLVMIGSVSQSSRVTSY